MRQTIDSLVLPFITKKSKKVFVVGIYKDGEMTTFGYGNRSDEGLRAPDDDSLFEIGSISKVFTTTLLAQMVIEGRVQLCHQVQCTEYMPLPKVISLLLALVDKLKRRQETEKPRGIGLGWFESEISSHNTCVLGMMETLEDLHPSWALQKNKGLVLLCFLIMHRYFPVRPQLSLLVWRH